MLLDDISEELVMLLDDNSFISDAECLRTTNIRE